VTISLQWRQILDIEKEKWKAFRVNLCLDYQVLQSKIKGDNMEYQELLGTIVSNAKRLQWLTEYTECYKNRN
jgi:hypothetical protein